MIINFIILDRKQIVCEFCICWGNWYFNNKHYRTGKTKSAKDVHYHYNEYSEFHTTDVEAHICAVFMEKMMKLDGNFRQMLCFNCAIISYQQDCAGTVSH